MTRAAINLILDLRDSGCSVRRDDTEGFARIMIAPPPTNPAIIARIKDNRAALLDALAGEKAWPAGEMEALTFWREWNRAVEARPQEVIDRRNKRTRKASDEMPLIDEESDQ